MINFEGPIERKDSGMETVLPGLESALRETSLEDRRIFRQLSEQLNGFLFEGRESL